MGCTEMIILRLVLLLFLLVAIGVICFPVNPPGYS